MAQGLQIWNQNSDLIFDTNDRVVRVIYSGRINASGIPNQTWTQVVPTTYAGSLWGMILPTYTIDGSVTTQAYWKTGAVSFDPVNHPGAIYVSGTWYDSDTATTTNYVYDNANLIYGVY
jgi:hypothetical protein